MIRTETEAVKIYDYRDEVPETWRRRRCPICGQMSLYMTKGEPLDLARFVHLQIVSKRRDWFPSAYLAYCRGRRPAPRRPEPAPGSDEG